MPVAASPRPCCRWPWTCLSPRRATSSRARTGTTSAGSCADPVDAATEAALEVLLTELDSAATEVDIELMARLDQLRRRAFLGTD